MVAAVVGTLAVALLSPARAAASPGKIPDDLARNSLIAALESPAQVTYQLTDAQGNTMDTAKIIQVGSRYYAVYSPGSKSILLATAADVRGPWNPVVTLDDDNASQPYLAQQADGSFILADEYIFTAPGEPGKSAVNFKHYASLDDLLVGHADKHYLTQLSLPGTAGKMCNEGTPHLQHRPE